MMACAFLTACLLCLYLVLFHIFTCCWANQLSLSVVCYWTCRCTRIILRRWCQVRTINGNLRLIVKILLIVRKLIDKLIVNFRSLIEQISEMCLSAEILVTPLADVESQILPDLRSTLDCEKWLLVGRKSGDGHARL